MRTPSSFLVITAAAFLGDPVQADTYDVEAMIREQDGFKLFFSAVNETMDFKQLLGQETHRKQTVANANDGSDVSRSDDLLGFLFNSMELPKSLTFPLSDATMSWRGAASLLNSTVYRNIPGLFPEGMDYFFDGLASIARFSFNETHMSMEVKAYESSAEEQWESCIFFGTGTGPTRPSDDSAQPQLCFKNPVVNMLPLGDQMWLTIDTRSWGRIDPVTLDTLEGIVDVPSSILNAHPACDSHYYQPSGSPAERSSNAQARECFVQYPCPIDKEVFSDQVCVGQLVPHYNTSNEKLLHVEEFSRSTLPAKKFLQQSHSPCITPNFVVSKLDEFDPINPVGNGKAGILKFVHQGEVNEWMVMDRRTNQSYIVYSDEAFVNNHFWNCYESNEGIVVQSVTATSDYLDIYFRSNLEEFSMKPDWWKYFKQPIECVVPVEAGSGTVGEAVKCKTLSQDLVFDYPTFNPYFKMNPDAKYFYAIAPISTETSIFFDRLVKIDMKSGALLSEWARADVYLTEANFIPTGVDAAEDDGVLFAVGYDASQGSSMVLLFDASTLRLIDEYPLGLVVPFHAHGLVCVEENCFPNP